MKEKLNFGLIGLGCRGVQMWQDVLSLRDDVEIIAVCDVYEDRCQEAAKLIKEKKGNDVLQFLDYNELLDTKDLDAVYIATSWQTHIQIGIASMKKGVTVAMEVSGAYSIDECWELVKTYEKTKTPFMFMENCCYGRDEMMVMNMVNQGVFGELVHCQGSYCHDLRKEVSFGKENRHYRLENYKVRNCENYPTHEFGPIAKILGLGRGNKMLTLSSFATKSAGLTPYIKENKADDEELLNYNFAQGDIVTTVIKCAGGETIVITLDTTLPRHGTRSLKVQGTKGLFMEDNHSIFLDGVHNKFEGDWKEQFNNVDGYREEYDHPTWKKFTEEEIKGGHGGMDWLEFDDFISCVKNGDQFPIDVYDMASWAAISVLSEESISLGGHPVAVPDFTNGKWITRK